MAGEDKGLFEKVTSKLEIAEDGQLSMNDLVTLLLKSDEPPVDRKEFLQEVFSGKYDQEVINKAIETTPTKAGISTEDLKVLAKEVIEQSKADTTKKSAIKKATEEEKKLDKVTGLVSAITGDRTITESLVAAQKILYLFGFPEIGLNASGKISSAKARLTMLMSLAVMYETENADEVLRAVADVLPSLPENPNLMKNLDKEEVGKILMSWRKKFIALATTMKAASSNPLLKVLSRKGTNKKTFDKLLFKLVDVVADTSLSNPEHVISEKEQQYADLIKEKANIQ